MYLGFGNRDRWTLYAVFVVVLVVAGFASVPMSVGGQSESDVGRIVTVNQTGTAVVATTADTTYVWQSEPYTANVTFQINASEDQYAVCLYERRGSGNAEELDCRSTKIGNGSTATVELNGSTAVEPGERTIFFRVRPTFNNDAPTIDNRSINQTVITKSGDVDNDGLENEFEVNQSETGWNETAFRNWDMDGDGIPDGQEYDNPRLDPTKADTDNDGLRDGLELNIDTDPSDPDTDGDKVDDGTEYNDPNLDPNDPNDATNTTAANPGDEDAQSGGISGVQLLLVAIVGMGVVGAAALLWRTNNDDSDPPVSVTEVRDTNETPPPEEDADESEDILTDEGVVLQLLRENRGRMKQVDVVEETGWSKSKVSRLLSRMEDRGDVNRLRVGRGNIVYLDGAKPSGARSPHEEDSYS
ncbi:helix-turn-helix transcriptional regulator [Haladaptatus cibarius]|uniref:helix-turn-helix transcriptional regulator n=1 Tax=Haladaptatus cibarius TaxID=453847 RepID=UPI00067885C5|nr:helix-turn-helix domain-containing protein [Haladaptatus cibarius]